MTPEQAQYRKDWSEAYMTGQPDPHKRFSELTGLNRQDAKQLCFRLIYSVDVLKLTLDEHQEYISNDPTK